MNGYNEFVEQVAYVLGIIVNFCERVWDFLLLPIDIVPAYLGDYLPNFLQWLLQEIIDSIDGFSDVLVIEFLFGAAVLVYVAKRIFISFIKP